MSLGDNRFTVSMRRVLAFIIIMSLMLVNVPTVFVQADGDYMYHETFSDGYIDSGIWYSQNNQAAVQIMSDSNTKIGDYLYFGANTNSRGMVSRWSDTYAPTEGDELKFEVDLKFTKATGDPNQFAIHSGNISYTSRNLNYGANGGYILLIEQTKTGAVTINGMSADIPENTWVHVYTVCNFSNHTVAVKVTALDSGSALFDDTVTMSDGSASCISQIYLHYGKQWNGSVGMDNIKIYEGEVNDGPIEGVCGDNLTWSLEDGVLTISGTGDMYDYSRMGAPWYEYVNKISSVTVEDGVTSIGQYAFHRLSNMRSVSLPDSLIVINSCAFQSCGISSITIPSNVANIGDYALQTTLSSIIVANDNTVYSSPDGMSLIKDGTEFIYYAVGNETDQYTIPNGVTVIDDNAFLSCYNLETLIIPDSVTTIGSMLFGSYAAPNTVYIGEGVETINSDAFWFRSGSGVQDIYISQYEKKTSLVDMPWGARNATLHWKEMPTPYFTDREQANTDFTTSKISTSINVDNITVEDKYEIAELNCQITNNQDSIPIKIENLNLIFTESTGRGDSEQVLHLYPAEMTDSEILEDIENGFEKEITPSSWSEVTTIYNIALTDLNMSMELFVTEMLPRYKIVFTNKGLGYTYNATANVFVRQSAYNLTDDGFTSTTSNTFTVVNNFSDPSYAYYTWDGSVVTGLSDLGRAELTEIDISDAATAIAEFAFQGCDNIISVKNTGANVTSIGYMAFANCNNLSDVTLSDSVTSIGTYAFENCTNLSSVTLNDGLQTMGSSVFNHCTALSSIDIPASVTSIGNIRGLGRSNEYTVADSNIAVGTHTLLINVDADNQYYSSLDGVLFNKDQTQILAYCKGNLDSGTYVIPETVTVIGCEAFRECNMLQYIELPSNLQCIGDTAFQHCYNIYDIGIPDSVTAIGDLAFSNNTSLRNLYISKYVDYLGDNIGAGSGQMEIQVDDENTYYSSVDGVLFSKDKTALLGYCKDSTSDTYTIPYDVTTIGAYAYYNCNYTTIIVPEGVTDIEREAFYSDALTGISLPSTIESIPNSIFDYGGRLTTIFVNKNRSDGQRIEGYQYKWGAESASLYWKDTAVAVRSGAASLMNSSLKPLITEITIPSSAIRIADNAFNGCTNLKSVTIPDGVSEIGNSAFNGCSSLTSVTIPDGITSINDLTFSGCSSLVSINIPSSVTYIGYSAFEYCSSLNGTLEISENIGYIGNYAFSECNFDSIYIDQVEGSIDGAPWGYSGTITWKEAELEPNSLKLPGNLETLKLETPVEMIKPVDGIKAVQSEEQESDTQSEKNSTVDVIIPEEKTIKEGEENSDDTPDEDNNDVSSSEGSRSENSDTQDSDTSAENSLEETEDISGENTDTENQEQLPEQEDTEGNNETPEETEGQGEISDTEEDSKENNNTEDDEASDDTEETETSNNDTVVEDKGSLQDNSSDTTEVESKVEEQIQTSDAEDKTPVSVPEPASSIPEAPAVETVSVSEPEVSGEKTEN